MARTWLIGAALLLGGCATGSTQIESPLHYADYRDALRIQTAQMILSGPYSAAPNRVRADYSDCVASFVVSKLQPDTLSKLDAYSRGETKMTIDEFRAVDAKGSTEIGGPLRYDNLDRLAGSCPDKIAEFKQSFGPGFNGL